MSPWKSALILISAINHLRRAPTREKFPVNHNIMAVPKDIPAACGGSIKTGKYIHHKEGLFGQSVVMIERTVDTLLCAGY